MPKQRVEFDLERRLRPVVQSGRPGGSRAPVLSTTISVPYCLQSASIIHVATLYVREVPERLYKRLRARARRNGRSLNAEVIEILEGTAARDAEAATVTRRLAELAKRIDLPVDAPKPEEIIRSERDRR
jgi:plasmid stability protein